MKLFYSPTSPFAFMVRFALRLTGLDDRVAKQLVTLRDPASALLPYNPVGRVPTLLLDNGVVLTESLLILAHLDTQHAGPRLLPLDGSDNWATMARLGMVTGMLESIAVWNRELRRPENERSPAVIGLETTRTGRVMDVLNDMIGQPGWNGPPDASQIALMAALGYCEHRHPVAQWRVGRPALAAWHDQRADQPHFKFADQPAP